MENTMIGKSFLSLLLLVSSLSLQAADITWTGAVSSNFSDAANWSAVGSGPNGIPGVNDHVIFDNSASVNSCYQLIRPQYN